MKCKICLNTCIKKGYNGIKQKYQCKSCKKYQQDFYTYKLYDTAYDKQIIMYNAECTSISAMARITGYSKQTIQRRLCYLGKRVVKPIIRERNQVYEVDEMWTYVGSNRPENFVWITYAINRRTKQVIHLEVGKRNTETLSKVIACVKALSPKKIITDKLNIYPKLVKPVQHDTGRYRNNRIERSNLTLRQHVKRLTRLTLSFNRSIEMLEHTLLLYLFWNNWKIGYTKHKR